MEKNTQTQLQFNGEHTDNDNNMNLNCDIIVVIFQSFTIGHRKCFRNGEKKHLFGGTSHFPASLKLTFCQRQAVDGYTKKGSGSINGPLAGVPLHRFLGTVFFFFDALFVVVHGDVFNCGGRFFQLWFIVIFCAIFSHQEILHLFFQGFPPPIYNKRWDVWAFEGVFCSKKNYQDLGKPHLSDWIRYPGSPWSTSLSSSGGMGWEVVYRSLMGPDGIRLMGSEIPRPSSWDDAKTLQIMG